MGTELSRAINTPFGQYHTGCCCRLEATTLFPHL